MSLDSFQNVLAITREKEEMSHDFCDARIITLYRKKRSKTDFGNYWGISLFSLPEKF